MQLHIFGENKSYKHFINKGQHTKNKKVSVQQTWQRTAKTYTGLAALSNAKKKHTKELQQNSHQ